MVISDDKGYSVTMELWVAEMEKIRSLEKRKSRSEDVISDGLF